MNLVFQSRQLIINLFHSINGDSDLKPFRCKWPGCESQAKRRDTIITHIRMVKIFFHFYQIIYLLFFFLFPLSITLICLKRFGNNENSESRTMIRTIQKNIWK